MKEHLEEKVKWELIGRIKPNPENPNEHPPEQIDRIAKLIEFYGWRKPLVISNQSGMLVIGHGRLEAARLMKLKKVPVVYQNFRSYDEEYGFMVEDNGISEWSKVNLKMVNKKLPDLGPMDIELLGLKDFVVEPADKFNEEKHKAAKKVTCPECGHVWDSNEVD